MKSEPNPVLSYIDENYREYVEKLQELARQPSVSAQNLGLLEAAELVKRMLEETGFQVKLVPLTKGPPVVYGTIGPKKKKNRTGRSSSTIIMTCNRSEPLELWKHPPFLGNY